MLPDDRKEVATHEGNKVSVAWAKHKNLESGINFDQVLLPRTLIQNELSRVTQAEIESPLPSAVEEILEKQAALYWKDSYYPQSAFIKNEGEIRGTETPARK